MVLIILAVIILLALVVGWIASSAATANQAQAAIEAARAAQIASAAQLETARSNSVLVVALVVMLALGMIVVGYLVYRLIKVQRMVQQAGIGQGAFGKWAPGPNANFQRQQMPQLMGSGDPLQMMMGMMAMQMMQEQMRQNQPRRAGQDAPMLVEQNAPVDQSTNPWGW